jgi:hypothetical protein
VNPQATSGKAAAPNSAFFTFLGPFCELDWKAQPVPGKSMFSLELGTSYADVVNLLKGREISEGVFQIENSGSMRLVLSSDKEAMVARVFFFAPNDPISVYICGWSISRTEECCWRHRQ